MTSSHARSAAARLHRGQLVELPPADAHDLDERRLLVPVARPGSVYRTGLVNRLRAARSYSVITVLAPAGYGKTTMLSQWADRDRRPFAWLSIPPGSDDLSFCKYVAEAIARLEPLEESVFDTLEYRRRSSSSIERIASMLRSISGPFVLVLDDVHVLRSRSAAGALDALAGHVPDGATLVLAGRDLPRMSIPRLRAERRLFEVGAVELAFGRRETELLLRARGVELPASDLAELTDRTEGWATGLSLASLSLPGTIANSDWATLPSGNDQSVSDYFEHELLARLSPKKVDFLTRTAVLDAMSGPLCDAVLESRGSGGTLRSIEKSNLFVVPLGRERVWYRYHHEFREFLRRELELREPDLIPALNRRAAAWCEANGAEEAAVSYAHSAGDQDLLAKLVGPRVFPALAAGKAAMVENWLGWFDERAGLERYPEVAIVGAWVHALRGRAPEAERWLDVAVRASFERVPSEGSDSIAPRIAVLEAAKCQGGPELMRSNAALALRELGPTSPWRPTALLLRGAAELLLGENDRAEASMADAAEMAASVGATTSRIAALAEQSLLAAAREDEAASDALALQARVLIDEQRLDDDGWSAVAFAAAARRASLRGDLELATAELGKAQSLRPRLSRAIPWYAVHTSLELARAHLSLLDAPGACAWLSHADQILRRCPDLGVLAPRRKELEAEVERVTVETSMLTGAELRLLPLLASHLTFREIGELLFVSRNTVKTQAICVYRKLGVSSRSEAIARAAELGLVVSPSSRVTAFVHT